jgi:DDE family transposase
MHTPFFPTLRCRLAALGQRTVHTLRLSSLPQLEQCLASYLPVHLLSAEEEGTNSRQRIYSLRLTFQCFIWQMLKPQTACREVVRQVQALFQLKGLGRVKQGASAYCQARLRLPRERLEKALTHLSQQADQKVGPGGRLGGRAVKVVDGTTVQLADTLKNQQRYPQLPHQQPGCGFPLLKLLALFSLASGAILTVIMDSYHNHDLRLFRRLWEELKTGDVILGDRLFGDYATLADLPQRGIDVVARLNVKRKVDFRKAKRLGSNDGLFVWTKSHLCPPYLTSAQWAEIPAVLTVRIVRFRVANGGSRTRSITLVTTLLDPKLYPLEELAMVYARRWRLELCFRDLKTQMGMEQLRCQTPDMAEKEALAYLVAHNLIRCVMAEAIASYQVELERVSFKGTVDSLRQFTNTMVQARNRKKRRQLWEDLIWNVARDLVPLRPGRREPRAVKHRPKSYPLLTRPRHLFKDRISYSKWLLRKKQSKNRCVI